MNNDFLLWTLITGGAVMVHFVIVMAAMLMRAHENKMDAITTVLTGGPSVEDERPLELVDDLGVSDESRLIHVHHHRDDAECDDWLLSIGPGVKPSSILAVYPTLRNPRGDAHYSPTLITSEHQLRVHLSAEQYGIFDSVDFPFESLELVFSGPSSTESFAMNLSTIAFHLADEYRMLAGAEAVPGSQDTANIAQALTERVTGMIDLNVAIHTVVLAGDR